MCKTANFCVESELLAVVSKTFQIHTRIETAQDTLQKCKTS